MRTKKTYINIEIAGECGTGKTTLANKIGAILKEYGMTVSILDIDEYGLNSTPEEIDRNLKAIGENGECEIRCRQLLRRVL